TRRKKSVDENPSVVVTGAPLTFSTWSTRVIFGPARFALKMPSAGGLLKKIVAFSGVTENVTAFDCVPSGTGDSTVTVAAPTAFNRLLGTVAWSAVAATKLVVSGVLFQKTRAVGSKLLPVTCSVTCGEPTGTLAGDSAVTT